METKKAVAVIAPASPPPKELYEEAVEILRSYRISFKSYVDFTASPPGFKAFLLQELLKDGNFFYIWSARGGFGSIKLLPYLDELLEDGKFNTYIVGFSDITALHLYFYKRFKAPGIHAPMITDLPILEETTVKILIDVLFSKKDVQLEGKHYRDGEAEGVLIGGNLMTLASLCGTSYFPDVKECILFVEDRKEKFYRLERAMLQIIFSIRKERIKGLILGDLGGENPLKLIENLKEFLPQNIPIGYDFPIGHNSKNSPVIIGKKAYLRAKGDMMELFQENFS